MPQTINKIYNKDQNFFRLLIAMLFVMIGCSLLQPKLFPTVSTFLSITKQFPEYGIMSIAIGLAMLTGGIDLSVVSIANLSAIFAARYMIANAPKGTPDDKAIIVIVTAVLIAIVVGLICGLINGVLISKIGIPAILATLGTQQLFSGIAIVITEGKPQSGLPMLFAKMSIRTIGGLLNIPLIIFILCAVFVGLLLSKNTFGSKIYMLGTNAKAAAYAGLNNSLLLMKSYMLSGGLAAIAGLIMMGRTNSAKADFGVSYTLQCVLIAVLGGVSPTGGKGNIQGIVLAVVILQMLSTTLSMFENISNFYRDIIWGLVLIAVLIINHYLAKNALAKQSK